MSTTSRTDSVTPARGAPAGVPTVARAGAVQMPLSTGFAVTVVKPCCVAAAGITAAPSVTVKGMCGKGREATTGCCCGFTAISTP